MGWPATDATATRRAGSLDVPALAALHDVAFPTSCATARQLVEGEGRITLVLDNPGGEPLGVARAEVQPDGTGYLDPIAVRTRWAEVGPRTSWPPSARRCWQRHPTVA